MLNSMWISPFSSAKRVSIVFLSDLCLKAFCGRTFVPLGNHCDDSDFLSTSSKLTQHSSPIMTRSKRSSLSFNSCKFISHKATLNLFCSSVNTFGTNFGHSFESVMSFFMMVCRLDLLISSSADIPLTVLLRSTWSSWLTFCTASSVWTLRGLPGLFLSLTDVSPFRNFLCQTRTQFLLTVPSLKTSRNFLQHWIGVCPLWTRNLMTVRCSTRSSIPAPTSSQQSTTTRQKDRRNLIIILGSPIPIAVDGLKIPQNRSK